MLEENKKILDFISHREDLKPLLALIVLIIGTVGFYYLVKSYDIEPNSSYITGTVVTRVPITSKNNNRFVCEIKLQTGETVRPECYKYRSIGEIIKVEKRTADGLFFNTTNYIVD
jgi:hypothetical protein